ncbi:uncharacterized protein [Parasteatoda tepidariorum]|uniref:uncharacterized protein isoform X2 n=2 Tax=Parasteatoda tepidariorum TaxID=114398 RepID=UPI001C723AB5|nr:inorganic pyrophosphatase isoform X3 [Parasteatoda tepidariorum]
MASFMHLLIIMLSYVSLCYSAMHHGKNLQRNLLKLASSRNMSFSIVERGSPNTLSYRIFYTDENGPISPFHDIPLFADKENKIYNMVVEIPRWTNAKMEIATKDALNPIKQDVKKGALRYVHNCFPHHGYIWNYGALPQTWEDPNHIDESTNCKGDNDPVDVCEIGSRVAKRGEVLQVKVVGVMALIDEGETDWKLIAIDINDPVADEINDIDDVEKIFPGYLRATHEWFRIYKMPAGNPENKFAFNGEPKNKEFAEKVVEDTHKFWQKLIRNETEAHGLNCSTVTVIDSPYKISEADALTVIQHTDELGSAQEIDPKVDKWHFVQLK